MSKKTQRILSYFQFRNPKRAERVAITTAIVSTVMVGMVTALAVTPAPPPDGSVLENSIRPLDYSDDVILPAGAGLFLHEDRIQKSDTLPVLLERLGIDDQEATNFLLGNTSAGVISRQLRPGKPIHATTDGTGRLIRLDFPLNGKPDSFVVVERQPQGLIAREEIANSASFVVLKAGEIRSSLFAATDAAGVPDSIATQLAEIFAGEIDFHRDLRKGDRFTVSYETFRLQGRDARIGRILAAEFVNSGRHLRAIHHSLPDGSDGYYDSNGKSLRKAFLRSPIEFSRVTSGYSSARLHPVLKEWRAHRGVDYGAPIGTRVRATGDGVIETMGRQGGYGNLLVLRHAGRYTTAYGHLHSFAPGLRNGSRVRQGDVIGFVGQTGLATGPHLHYEFRVDDQQVNPLAVIVPESPPLATVDLEQFRDVATSAIDQLSLARATSANAFD